MLLKAHATMMEEQRETTCNDDHHHHQQQHVSSLIPGMLECASKRLTRQYPSVSVTTTTTKNVVTIISCDPTNHSSISRALLETLVTLNPCALTPIHMDVMDTSTISSCMGSHHHDFPLESAMVMLNSGITSFLLAQQLHQQHNNTTNKTQRALLSNAYQFLSLAGQVLLPLRAAEDDDDDDDDLARPQRLVTALLTVRCLYRVLHYTTTSSTSGNDQAMTTTTATRLEYYAQLYHYLQNELVRWQSDAYSMAVLLIEESNHLAPSA